MGQLTIGQALAGGAGGIFGGLSAARGNPLGALLATGGAFALGGPVAGGIAAGGSLIGGLVGLFGGGGRPTFLADRLEPQAFEDAFGIFRSQGFDDPTARLLAGRVRNDVGNVGEGGQFPGDKNNQGDLQNAFTRSVNETLLAQKGVGVTPFTPTGRTLFAAHGFDGIVNRPTTLHVAERGPERVRVEPIGWGEDERIGGRRDNLRGRAINVNINIQKGVIANRQAMKELARDIQREFKRMERRRFRA